MLTAAPHPRNACHTRLSVQRPRSAAAERSEAVGWNALLDATGSLLPELLGKPDENSFGAPDVAEPIRVFVLDHFADELCAAFAEPGERIVDVLHGEHDA